MKHAVPIQATPQLFNEGIDRIEEKKGSKEYSIPLIHSLNLNTSQYHRFIILKQWVILVSYSSNFKSSVPHIITVGKKKSKQQKTIFFYNTTLEMKPHNSHIYVLDVSFLWDKNSN